jgi:Domain of unknown function (DUF4124)
MKKIVLLLLVSLLTAGGFLYYDWHVKTKRAATQPPIKLYEWTDQQGVRHFTDTPPPQGDKGVKVTRGSKYISPPLIFLIEAKARTYYYRIRDYVTKRFSSKPKKNKKE